MPGPARGGIRELNLSILARAAREYQKEFLGRNFLRKSMRRRIEAKKTKGLIDGQPDIGKIVRTMCLHIVNVSDTGNSLRCQTCLS
jgi:hypothetical protein